MARITYNQVNSVGDVLDQSAFEFLMGQIPGGGTTEDFTFLCQNVQLPGFSNEAFEVALHGFTIKYRGKKNFERTLAVTYVERSNMGFYRRLKAWDEYTTGTESGNSRGYKRQYSITSALRVYDTIGALASEHRIEGMFIQDLQSATLDGSSSAALQLSVSFSYDRFYIDGVTPL